MILTSAILDTADYKINTKTITMNYLLSKEHFLAYEQTKEDYKNLICHYADFKLYRKGTAQSDKAKQNCYKYLLSIIKNKKILKIDATADELMLDELFDRIK